MSFKFSLLSTALVRAIRESSLVMDMNSSTKEGFFSLSDLSFEGRYEAWRGGIPPISLSRNPLHYNTKNLTKPQTKNKAWTPREKESLAFKITEYFTCKFYEIKQVKKLK